MPVPVQLPRLPVSTLPMMGLPETDGGVVLAGPAADAASTDPADRTARAMTATPPPIQRHLVAELRSWSPPLVLSNRFASRRHLQPRAVQV